VRREHARYNQCGEYTTQCRAGPCYVQIGIPVRCLFEELFD
jgi:hypothetical protein